MQTPYIIFKPNILEKNYKEFEKFCQIYLKRYVIAYSVKTNSYKPLIKTLNKLNSNFEVASLNEINLTKISKKSKIFNSPCKTNEELEIAIENKFLINTDSKSEINKISSLLNSNSFNIGIRISTNNSKFGFSSEQLDEVINYCKSKNLNIISLHFHAGTQQTLENFEQNLKSAEKITIDLIKKHNLKLKYLDIGGGFPDKVQLKNLNPKVRVESNTKTHINLEDYFKLIKRHTDELGLSVILEPGRCLTADAFELITRVCVIKEKPSRTYAILDAGINILPKITLSQYKFSKVTNLSESEVTLKKQEYTLVGPLLFNNDIVGRFIGSLKEGDLIKVENIGAYCYNLAWEISYGKPEIVER